MRSSFSSKIVALLLIGVLTVPSTLLITPAPARAQILGTGVLPVNEIGASLYADIKTSVQTSINVIQTTITKVAAISADLKLAALVFDTYVLQPLAFVLSGNLLKAITAGTIAFVIGKANGTGIPQFVADVETSLQTVSDSRTLMYFNEFIRSSQSPWNTSIVSQLKKEYLNKTSLGGFWAQNMDTLRRTSPNIYGYLGGNWALGGVGSWFALTTTIQNNPYLMYPTARDQLAMLIGAGVGGATGARALDISNGQGFVSWCGDQEGLLGDVLQANPTAVANAAAVDAAGQAAYQKAYDKAIAGGDTAEEAETLGNIARANAKTDAFNKAKAANAPNAFLGVAPGDPCTKADGTTGTIKTPGSVIIAGLNKVLGGQQDNVVRMGNVGPQINAILENIAYVLKTVNFASQILGGPGSGGLFGVNAPSGSGGVSPLRAYANSAGNLGVTNTNVLATAATLPSSGSDMLERATQYETAINTIRSAATTASTNLTSLIGYCVTQQLTASSTLANGDPTDMAALANFMAVSNAQISAAQTTLTTQVAPVLTRIDTASTTIAAARALVQKIQSELNSTSDSATATYTNDLQTLQSTPPSLNDLAVAQQDATPTDAATANSPGSLSVSGGALVDRLAIISANAATLQSSCTAPAPTFVPLTPIPTPEPSPTP